ncbi:MAG: hypothetical protein H7Z14_18785 [Anaerolineae bacterium]|nr:hypothetical protein [Phycisphaerae bacterium]
MSELNPFAGAILPSAQAQRQQSAERVNQVRRTQELKKNAGQQGADVFVHEVESTDAVAGVHDDDTRHDPRKKRGTTKQFSNTNDQPDEEPPHLDLTA